MTLGSPDHELLRTVIHDLTGFDVVLDPAEPNTLLNPGGQIFIDVKAGTIQGWDNLVRRYDSGLDTILITQTGNRLFTLTVRMESYLSNVHAHEVLETLRLRLERPNNLARLRTGGMTVATSAAIVDLPTTYDNRVLSVSAMDLHMSLRFQEETLAWLSELTGDRLDGVGSGYGLTRGVGESDADFLLRIQAAAALDEGNYINTMDLEYDSV